VELIQAVGHSAQYSRSEPSSWREPTNQLSLGTDPISGDSPTIAVANGDRSHIAKIHSGRWALSSGDRSDVSKFVEAELKTAAMGRTGHRGGRENGRTRCGNGDRSDIEELRELP
jgi:hypothetical protein